MSSIKRISRTELVRRRIRSLVILMASAMVFSGLMVYLKRNLYNSNWISGYILFGSILILAAFHWRKKITVLPWLGSAAAWMQFHIYLGIGTFVMFGWHVNWALPNGPFEQLLGGAYALVALSGLFGLYLTRSIPRRLAAVKRQFIFEQIPVMRLELIKRAHRLVFGQPETNETLARVYVNRVASFLESKRSWTYAWAPSGGGCRRVIAELISLDRYLSPAQRETSRDLMGLVREKDDLDFHWALQGKLKAWQFLHLAMTYSLLTLTIVHLILVHAFSGGWR